MKSKYVVFATILLLTLSSSVSMVSASICPASVCLPITKIDTHGPRVNEVLFSVVSTDASLKAGIVGNTFQGPEWTFTVGSYTSLLSNHNVGQGTTTTYTFDGIGFNTLRPYMNNVNFRQAMAYITSYSYIKTTVLSGVAGSAGIGVLPCAAYPGACYTGNPTYHFSNAATNALYAYKDMIKAGLVPGNATDVATLGSIPNWFMGTTYTTDGGATYPCSSVILGSAPATWPSACQFHPLFWYRADDPLRTGVATQLCSSAISMIGFHINCQGTYGSGGHIYGPAAEAVVSPGSYISPTAGNTAPVWNSAVVNGTGAVDVWDMYTYGWITSANYVWAAEFFNSQFAGTSVNFGNYNYQPINILSNALLYASTMTAARTAAKALAYDLQIQLPYLMSFYQNTLWAVRSAGWTGYANVPTTGPDTGGGLYYTLLNVHPTNNPYGGTFKLALHQVADTGGMNPLYNTNWVWQADIYGEIYETPLGTYPSQYNVVNSFFNWMTVGKGTNPSQWVQPFTGTTGTGPGWFQMQGAQGVANKITNGQVITFTFRNNITFSDHVQLTAYDYNFSLYAWGITLPPTLPDTDTPISGLMAGSAGLWATYINPANPYQIKLYINSSSVWNLANTQVLVLPQHIFKYFNVDLLSTASGAMDLTQPYSAAMDASFLAPGVTSPSAFVQSLPNLEVGSGPFYLYAYNGITGAGELLKNINYQRAAWKVIAALPANRDPSSYTFSTIIEQYVHNGGPSPNAYANDCYPAGGPTCTTLAVNSWGWVGITNATTLNVVKVWSGSGCNTVGSVLKGTYSLTNDGKGKYHVVITTTGWAKGHYEICVNAPYKFLHQNEVWIPGSRIHSVITSRMHLAIGV